MHYSHVYPFLFEGILPLVQKYFDIGNSKASLLQTVFVCAYMVFAPVFGYLGDRVSRKYVMAVGILLWTVFTFVGSLMGPNVSTSLITEV